MQGGGGRGRAGGGKRGRSLNDQGTGPVRKEPSQSPSALLRALSHGVLEQKGAGWPDWLACPWGQREGPRPARGAARSLGCSPPRPSPPLPSPQAGNVLFPPLPPRGQRAGRAGRCPRLLLPPPPPRPGASRAATTAAAPDSRRPRAGAARGVGRGEGLGEPAPPGGRAPRARRPRRPLGPVPLHRPAAGLRAPLPRLRGRGACQPGSLWVRAGRGEEPPPPSVHSLLCWSVGI